METPAHQQLKRLALGFLRERGCQAVAMEVRCPGSRYRVDVAGYLEPRGVDHRRRGEPRTVVIECKQARSDFLRDHRRADELLAMRDELERMTRNIEERRIKVHEPHLRRCGTTLFEELDEWDFSGSRLRGYRQLLRKIRRLQQQLYGETKFFTINRYRLADRLYVAAPKGMIRPYELPRGWGLLECARRGGQTPLGIVVEAPHQHTRPEHRARLLRNIAVSASGALMARMVPLDATGSEGSPPR